MPRKVAGRRLAVTVLLVLGAASTALAADPPFQRNADRAHPDAEKINQANPRVVHAGPGVPLTGSLFVPPSSDKAKRK